MTTSRQTTLRSRISLSGAGVHSGVVAGLVLKPAPADTGIRFLRKGSPAGVDRLIDANVSNVAATELCTVVGGDADTGVATIEHLMAAFAGLGVDNALVEVDGPEIPILDGSAAPFVAAIEAVGIREISAPRRFLKILKPVRVEQGRSFAELRPAERGFRLDVEIDFASPLIGRQRRQLDLTPESFRREVSRARTFGFMRDVERLWKAGYALGASLDNTVALGEDRIINPDGLRYVDEFVRHKTLDAVGDLALAGLPIVGRFRSYCGGHRMNAAVLDALFADRAAFEVITDAREEREPRRAREAGRAAEIGLGLPAAAYAADAS